MRRNIRSEAQLTAAKERQSVSEFRASVVIPLFNKAPFIRRTLESVLSQDHLADEIIVVDDASTDGSVDAIRDMIEGRVRLIRQENAGPGPTRNRGIREASRPWVAFIDGDDLWRRDHLSTLADLHSTFGQADVLATGFKAVNSDEDCDLRATARKTDGATFDYFNDTVEDISFNTSCVAIRRETLLEVRGFPAICPGEDRVLWTRLALDHIFAASGKPTSFYVRRTGGVMESEQGRKLGFFMHPVFDVIAAALDDPRYSNLHDALREHRRSLLRMNVRQALYRGEARAAREYIREMERTGPSRLGMLRPLSWLPESMLAAGMAVRSRLLHARSWGL